MNEKLNKYVREHLEQHPDMQLVCKFQEVMRERGLTIQDLSYMTGIRTATLSEMINMRRTTLNIHHVIAIAIALRVTNIGDLFQFDYSEETKKQFIRERRYKGLSRSMEENLEFNRTRIEREKRYSQLNRIVFKKSFEILPVSMIAIRKGGLLVMKNPVSNMQPFNNLGIEKEPTGS